MDTIDLIMLRNDLYSDIDLSFLNKKEVEEDINKTESLINKEPKKEKD